MDKTERKYFPAELHCHTVHSDGAMTPAELVENAAKRGYAAIALTDHNTSSAYAEAKARADRLAGFYTNSDLSAHGERETYTDRSACIRMNGVSPAYAGKARAETESAGLGVIRGVEWTTFFGHILCLYDGAGEAADWRKFKKENFDGFAEAAREKGAVLIAAHPRRLGTPVGTGCRFEYNESCFKYFSAFEVWSQNEPNDSPANRLAVKMYDGLLCKGYKLAAVYGYDWHKPLSDAKLFANTYIGAENASPEALKDGLRRGDAYAALGISAELYADGERTPFGAEIERGIRTFELKIGGGLCPCPAEPRIFRAKGTAVCRMEKASVGAYNAFYGADKHGKPETACGVNAADFKVGEKSVFEVQSGWLRFEIFGADGKPLLSASPIYVK